MNLLGAKLYDPAVAVSKATSSLLALTAVDTTNLRLAVTVPAHGMVRFRLMCTITGATTFPVVLLGVLNGATVVARATPTDFPGTASAATQTAPCVVEIIATGLAPGAANFDAAYAVQVLVASTNIKYGGPNTNAGANAWGGFLFEAWDPQPMTANSTLAVDTSGRVDVSKVAGTTQTARDLGAQLDVAVSTRLAPTTAGRTLDVTATGEAGIDWANIGAPTTAQNLSGTTISTTQAVASVSGAVGSVTGAVGSVTAGVSLAASQHVIVDSGTVTTLTNLPAITAGWITATGIAASALNGKGDWNIGKTGYSLTQAFPTNFAAMSLTAGGLVTLAGVTHTGAVIPTVSAVTGLTASNLDATVSSRLPSASYTAPPSAATNATAVRTELTTELARLDVATSTRLATAGYTAPDNADIALIKAKTDNLPAAPASTGDVTTVGAAVAAISATLGAPAGISVSADVAAVKADTAAVKTATDQLAFTAGNLNANVKAINCTVVTGSGTAVDPWRP